MTAEMHKAPQGRPAFVGAAAFARKFFRMPLTAPRCTVDVLTFMPADIIAWALFKVSGIILYGTLPPVSTLGDEADVQRTAAMIEAEMDHLAFAGEIVTEAPLPSVRAVARSIAAEHALEAVQLAAQRRRLTLRCLSQAQVAAACGASGAARVALEGVVRDEGLGTVAEGGPSIRECQAILWALIGGLEQPPATVPPRPQPKAVTSPKAVPGDVKAARQAAAIATYKAIRGAEAAPKGTTKRKSQPAAGMPKPKTKAQLAAMRALKIAARPEVER